MKILTIDIGTGTQDIFVYDSRLGLENGFKLVMPSPTMMVYRRIKEATRHEESVLLTGVTMGGGPSQWAAEAHVKKGLPIFATPEAALSFNDELDKVKEMGIRIVSEDEAAKLAASTTVIKLRDLDLAAIGRTLNEFDVSPDGLAAIAVAAFDHGNAPSDISDRQFRFDYLDQRIRENNALSAFAYLSSDVPTFMTRLQAVVKSAIGLSCPLVLMDTAPAAVLGATFDPLVAMRPRKIIANIGNFHTLAFRLGTGGIEGVFEHHTGEITLEKLEHYIRALADGSLRHKDVFDDKGHGALIYGDDPLPLGVDKFDVVVTGPRRSLFRTAGRLRPYFAVPFGDMMITGCFGLLAAVADVLPELAEPIRDSLQNLAGSGTAPWDVD
jgi:uncharacterized protein (DUF1786 family)